MMNKTPTPISDRHKHTFLTEPHQQELTKPGTGLGGVEK